MRNSIVGLLLLFGLLLSSCSPQKTLVVDLGGRVIKVRTDPSYPPFESINPKTKQIEGFDVDIAKEVCVLINCIVDFKAVNWDSLVSDIANGKFEDYDMIMSALSITAVREKTIDLSKPYIVISQSIAVSKAKTSLTIADFKAIGNSLILGAQEGTKNAQLAKDIAGQARLKTFNNIDSAIIALTKGEIDGLVLDGLTANDFLKEQGGKFVVNIRGLQPDPIGMAFETNDSLVKSFNEGLRQLKTSSKYDQLITKWFR